MHSLFNIPVFQAAFSWVLIVKATVFYKGKLNSKCAYIAQNARWITSVLSDDIDAILPCTAIYNQPKFSHYALANERWIITVLSDDSVAILPCTAIYNQPKLSLCSIYNSFKLLFNAILHSKQIYLTWEKCIQCALTLHRIRDELQVFYPNISMRSCHVRKFTTSQNLVLPSMFNIQ